MPWVVSKNKRSFPVQSFTSEDILHSILVRTRSSVSVTWVACGTCYTKTEGTEVGGIEAAETGFRRRNAENWKIDKKEKA